MGAGKGYLTFAVADYLANTLNRSRSRRRRVPRRHWWLCNDVGGPSRARPPQLRRRHASRTSIQPAPTSLIALHACDTATDDAIAKGIAAASRSHRRRALLPQADPARR
jgi:hypothetical protein